MSEDKDAEIAALKARLEALERSDTATKDVDPPTLGQAGKPLPKGVYFFAALLILGAVWIVASIPKADAPVVPGNEFTPTQIAIAEEAAKVRAQSQGGVVEVSAWRYSDSADPMTDRRTSLACTTSTNLIRLDLPYDDVAAELCIRQSPKWGLDVFVQLRGSGQILCRPFRDCSVKIRFAEGAQQSFSAADAADGSSNIIFITNASRFVAGAKGADLTRVELTLYQAGNQIVEFNTKGLEWPRPAPAAVAQ